MAAPNAVQYGSFSVPGQTRGSTIATRDEDARLLVGRKSGYGQRWRGKMVQDVRPQWTGAILLLCYTITGFLDSSSTLTWGTFVSMQTGNTVFLGLGPVSSDNRWKKSGLSILAFCLGSFCFGRLHRSISPSPRSRWVLCLAFVLQALFSTAAASIVTWGPRAKEQNDASWYVVVPIALIAFQSGGQAMISRAVKHNALTSVVLTSIYCDLFSDTELFKPSNPDRNTRVAAPVSLMIGVIAGGLITKSSLGTAGVLWIVAGIKLLLIVVWLIWPGDEEGA